MPIQMTQESMAAFAVAWVDAWNRRDVDAVLSHFADDAQFVSPVAGQFVGRPELQNKRELEDYWRAAMARLSMLHFKLDRTIWDGVRRELVVIYEANLNGERKRACEIMTFNAEGRQIRGEALYGAVF